MGNKPRRFESRAVLGLGGCEQSSDWWVFHPETSSLKLSFIYLVFLISLGFSEDSKEIQL